MKKARKESNKRERIFDGRISTIVTGVLVLAMLAVLVVLVWQKSTTRLSNPADYEGRIVDRWADHVESDRGSRTSLRLVVESQEGKRFTVSVNPIVYESAKVGMGIKSRGGQIVLIDSDRGSGK